MKRLENKVAFITGGNSGMGLTTARQFVEQGAKVAITARRQEAVEEFKSNSNGSSTAWLADVSDVEATREAIKSTVDKYGKIDILFLNAGIGRPRPIEMADKVAYQEQWDTNFGGVYFTIQSALPYLNDGASIVMNTSVANMKGMPGMGVYAATKAGLRSLTRTLTVELAPRGIRVNAVSPGPIATPIWGKMEIPEEEAAKFGEQVKSQVPLGRIGKPEEVSNAVTFLASDEASFVNGIELAVDGGMAQV